MIYEAEGKSENEEEEREQAAPVAVPVPGNEVLGVVGAQAAGIDRGRQVLARTCGRKL